MANVFDQVPPTSAGPFQPQAEWEAGRVWGYAGFWWRVLAWVIDSLILSFADVLLHRAFGGGPLGVTGFRPDRGAAVSHISDVAGFAMPMPGTWHPTGSWLITAFGLLLQVAYFALLESSAWQATVGKRACGLRVTRLDGGRISLGRAVGRYFAKFLSWLILGIGFLMVAWTRRKQGLHDILAETLVVRRRPPSDLVRFNPPA